jgi:hypothetical protein
MYHLNPFYTITSYFCKVHFYMSFHLLLDLTSCYYHSDFLTTILYKFLTVPFLVYA